MKRLFIAAKIPIEDNFKQLLDIIKFHLKKEIIKWVELENLHITFQFLGDTDEELIPEITSSLNKLQLQVKSFKYHLEGLGIFNNMNNPRVLWIGIKPVEDLIVLKELIDRNLIDLDFKFKNEHDFKPHLTIGRIKKIRNFNKLKNTLHFNQDILFQEVTVNQVDLFESTLTPDGPIYTSLSKFNLR